jgi:hypothetical protein
MIKRRNKYGNKKVTADGYIFDSKLEFLRYRQLKIFEDAGEITELKIHPKYVLVEGVKLPSGKRQSAITWSADFEYIDSIDGKVVEDVKSPSTAKKDSFRVRVKLFQVRYGIEVTILMKDDII